jgi:hypothetical protein
MSRHTAEHFMENLYIPPRFMNNSKIDSGSTLALGNILATERARILNKHTLTELEPGLSEKIDTYIEKL